MTPMQVTLVIPATPDFLRLARLASSDAGSRAGFDYEEIDDLRMAVSELCHLVIGEGSGGSVSLQFEIGPDGVSVEGHATGVRAADAPGNEFTTIILETITDFHQIEDEPDGKRFRIVKHRHPTDA